MKELIKRMAQLEINIQLTKQAREFLVDKGFDPAFGARPLKRALQKYIEDPIAEEILRNKFGQGSLVKVRLSKKTQELKFSEGRKRSKDAPPEPEKPQNASVS